MRSVVQLSVFLLMLFTIISGQKHECEGENSGACITDESCEWISGECVVKCSSLVLSQECVDSECVLIDNLGCRAKAEVLALPCLDFQIRSQCLSQEGCYWRVGETGFVGRDNIGTCVNASNCEAVDKDECDIFRVQLGKQCFFYNESCGVAGCEEFVTEDDCSKHGVPNLFCSWDNDAQKCEIGERTCENSGAKDHATCFKATEHVTSWSHSVTKCFWRYDEGICDELKEALTCSELDLEECESLPSEYVGQHCKVLQNECRSVTACVDVVGSEIDCISNSSQTNQCFYLSSIPPSNSGVKKCILQNEVTCDKLETKTKCYLHGIAGLLCEWNSGACVNENSCETILLKENCVANTSCFFAVDADSYFRTDTYRLPLDPAKGSCHTLIGGDDASKNRNKCKYLINPTQCNFETHLETENLAEGGTTEVNVQDCLYSVCAGNVDSNCEGKCVPWSMRHPASDLMANLKMDTPDDCTGIVDSNQCTGFIRTEAEGGKANVPFCGWENQHCYAIGFDGNDSAIVEGDCGQSFLTETECNDRTGCTWIDESCKLQSTSSCESVVLNLDNCDSTIVNGHQCHKYETYFKAGYQEVVQYRCKEYVALCNSITDAKQCNDAGSGDGQTCFWLDTFNEGSSSFGGKCVDPQNPLLKCSDFIASQCPVTDAQLLPFVGAKIVCKIDEGGLGCGDSSFLSIPNYCAQYRYHVGDVNYTNCINTGMCIPVEVVAGVEGVCIPDSANTPTCSLFKNSELCPYVDFTDGNTHVGINCEWLSVRGNSAECVDANFVQCEDVTIDKCETGLRGEKSKCLVDEGECKINRCSSVTNAERCSSAQDSGCEWDPTSLTCVKKTCEKYNVCPLHCSDVGGCKTYESCGSVASSDKCPEALPRTGKRCYWSDGNTCVDVNSALCNESTIQNECENMKPNDGYGCEFKETKCVLVETISCQGIIPDTPEQCNPGAISTALEPTKRLFAHFGEWCDYNGNTKPPTCQPKCAAIENGEDCLRESKYCDFFVGNKCKSRFFLNGDSSNCGNSGVLECVFPCRWVDNVTGCEVVPEEPDVDNSNMNKAVIIGSVVGGVVIVLLIIGIIVAILLYMRMKKKAAEEEERLRREAEEVEDNEEEGAEGGSGGGYGGGGESKNVSMDANPEGNADPVERNAEPVATSSSSSSGSGKVGDEGW